MIITQPTYQAYMSSYLGLAYTIPVIGGGVARFNRFASLYQSQLTDLGIFNLNNPVVASTIKYKIPFCKLTFLSVPIWTAITGVVKRNIITGNVVDLILNVDFSLSLQTIGGNSLITGLDFKCLAVNCDCEEIIITGFYGIPLPAILVESIYLIIYNNLNLENENCGNYIKSKSSGEASVSYRDKTKAELLGAVNNPNNLLSFFDVNRIVLKYKYYFLTLS